MPLLDDSKSVYVGTTPITKVMAGDVKVWPKVEPLPTQIKTETTGTPENGQFVTWEYVFTDCGSLTNDWSVRYGLAENSQGGGAIGWQPWNALTFFNSIYWFYSPDHQRLAWSTLYTLDNEWDSLSSWVWYQVRDNRTGQTIINENFDRLAPEIPRPSNAYACESFLPISENITTDVPGDPQKRIYVAFDNKRNDNCVGAGAIYYKTGVSESADGSTEPIYWSASKRLNTSSHVMIWPTYNSIVWSPDEANNANPNLRRLWYWLSYSNSFGGSSDIVKGQIDQYAPFYPYPSGDVVTC